MDYVNLSSLIQTRASLFGPKTALKYRDCVTSQWIPISWKELSDKVDVCANSLVALGINEGERIGVFSQNMPEVLYVNFAAYSNGAVAVPLYATSSANHVEYILNDADVKILFVGEEYQYKIAKQVFGSCPGLRLIVVFDSNIAIDSDSNVMSMADFMSKGQNGNSADIVAERRSKSSDSDLVDILYTSGTTGEPKGVMLHQYNYTQAFKNHDIKLTELKDDDVAMDFLPLTHIFERAWTYFCLHRGVQICINTNPADIQKTILEVRPTVMCSVPRFWEKVYSAVKSKMSQSRGLVRLMMFDALKTGKAYNVDYLSKGRRIPTWLKLKHWFYDKTVYSYLKQVIGIENGNFFPTAGATVPDKVFEFCRSVGIRLIVGYGLTESTATVSFTDFDRFVIGSVGEVMPNVDVRIADDGEIQIKGATVTSGYYNKPEANAQAFTEDGWFRTGDAGRLEGNILFLTDRLKDLFKTSNGKYIAPQAIEAALVIDRYIDQICVIADRRKYVSALIVPDFAELENYARSKGIVFEDRKSLVSNPEIYLMLEKRIKRLQSKFALFEQVKRFTLLPEPFTMDKGELTNTLKVRRQIVCQHYAEVIDKMYEE